MTDANTHPGLPNEEARMSTLTVTCPHCQSVLRSDRPLRRDRPALPRLQDLLCRARRARPCRAASASFLCSRVAVPGRAPLIIAAVVSLLLGGAIIAGAVIISLPRTAPPKEERDDRGAEERRRLEEERKKLAEEREKNDRESRKREYRWVMNRAEDALGKHLYADAKKAFKEALDLIPNDPEALKGLQTATAGLATAEKTSEVDAKNKVEVERLLAESKKAMADKQYAAAVRLLTAAQHIAPANRSVVDALLDAQKRSTPTTPRRRSWPTTRNTWSLRRRT